MKNTIENNADNTNSQDFNKECLKSIEEGGQELYPNGPVIYRSVETEIYKTIKKQLV